MTFSPPSRTRELYTGEVWEYDFVMDRWKLILTSWGFPVEDNRFIDAETLFQKGWKQEDIQPHMYKG